MPRRVRASIGRVERHRAARQRLRRSKSFRRRARAVDRAGIVDRQRHSLVAAGEIRVEFGRLLKEAFGQRIVLGAGAAHMPQPALVGRPGVEVVWRLAHRPLQLGLSDRRGDRDRHRLTDLVLHREDVGEVAVVALGPDVVAGLRLDQLSGNADAVAGFAQAAFEDIAHTQFAPDLLHIDGAALVGEAGIARDHEQRGIARKRGDDILGDTVSEEFLLGIARHIDERQERDRRLVGQRQRRCA
jgi:hypothetical protein